MPDFSIDDHEKLPNETFPYEVTNNIFKINQIKINTISDSIFLSMIKNMSIKNVLNDEII